jgi:rhodanese-related sulfurtransferase
MVVQYPRMASHAVGPSGGHPVMSLARDAVLLLVAAVALAAAARAIRSSGLPWIQRTPYEVIVPCPEPTGRVDEIAPTDSGLGDRGTLVVDARGAGEFAAWHLAGAINVEYDYLDPTPDTQVRRVAGSGARRVVVYGDGQEPDSGRQLAQELASKGIRNVVVVRGGAPALQSPERGDR